MAKHLPDTNVGNIEYISKQDAVDMFNRAVQDVGILDADDIETVFGMLSSADVVPVVRCRYCRYCVDHDKCCHPDWLLRRKEDDFCSYGKRKE